MLVIKMMGGDFLHIMQTASLCVTLRTQLCVSHLRLRSWIDIRLNVAQLCFNTDIRPYRNLCAPAD